MRRFLIIVMLLLLPLRGLVGDAMAYSMLPAGLAPAQTVALGGIQDAIKPGAAYAHSVGVGGTFDAQNVAPSDAKPPCHMDMAAGGSADTGASQCTTCQMCHLSASVPMQLPSGMLHTSKAVPAQRADHWISADPRLLAKTPVL